MTKPIVDTESIERIYGELEGMTAELDPDPLEYGPKRLNNKVAEVRRHLSRCERIYLQISHDLQWYRREHRRTQAEYDLMLEDLLAHDPEVRGRANLQDRMAVAGTKLRPQRQEINAHTFAIQDLDTILKVVATKRADLKDMQSRLKDQMNLCQAEISLGSRWGQRLNNPPVLPDPTQYPRVVADPVLAGVEGATDIAPLTTEENNLLGELEEIGGPARTYEFRPAADLGRGAGELEAALKAEVTPEVEATTEPPPEVAASPAPIQSNEETTSDLDSFLEGIDDEPSVPPQSATPKPQTFEDVNIDDLLAGL